MIPERSIGAGLNRLEGGAGGAQVDIRGERRSIGQIRNHGRVAGHGHATGSGGRLPETPLPILEECRRSPWLLHCGCRFR